MVYLLTAFNHQIIEAHDGVEGIEVARREKPDLILLDIHMPRMDGYEVARHLQRDPECRRIPIVAVTALAMVGDREKILAAGFTGYIAKPIDPETFPAQVQSFIGAGNPAPRHPPARVPLPAPQPKPARQKFAVVLFVDNVQTNIDLVRSILEPSGYQVLAALSVPAGLELARRTKPDLILSDVHMPHEDGYGFMRRLQEDPELSRIPFVFLSSSVWSIQEQQHALRQGAMKFISRPIEPEVLLEQLKECMPKTAD
jgi:two-component system, cell cycle response regulator